MAESKEEGKNIYFEAELESISKFCKQNKFQSVISTFISHNFTEAEELRKLEIRFGQIDKNQDGKISYNEFK